VHVLVGYESVLGHTRLVAESVAAGLRRCSPFGPGSRIECAQVGWLSADLPDVDLLVLGAPTHFLGLPDPHTRQMWVRGVVEASRRGRHRQLEPGSAGPGLREFLADLPDAAPVEADILSSAGPSGRSLPGARMPLAAAFDTRLARPFAPGASRSVARCLRRHGYRLVLPPEGFQVTEMDGPLRSGELERAERWGETLATRFVATVAS
jgi:hypothetical protein